MVVYVLDRRGVMSNSLTFYVRYGFTEITSTFDLILHMIMEQRLDITLLATDEVYTQYGEIIDILLLSIDELYNMIGGEGGE